MEALSVGTVERCVCWFDIVATRWTVAGRLRVSAFGSFPIREIISDIISTKLILLLSDFCVCCWWDDRTLSLFEILCHLLKHLHHFFFRYCARHTAFTAVAGVDRRWDPSGDAACRTVCQLLIEFLF